MTATIQKPAQRASLQADDMAETGTMRRVLNDIFLGLQARLEALESARGVIILPTVTFETSGTVGPTSAPFDMSSGGIRITCPFTPTGLVLLNLVRVQPAGQAVSGATSDVKWHYAAGPGGSGGDGAVHIDYVTGLAVLSRYEMTVGVTRA